VSPLEASVLVQFACLLEVSAPKPGNVSRHHDFPDTTFEDFLLSAAAVGPVFARAGELGVGDLVLLAVEETQRLVFRNTNLGIVLLLAPLARAATKKAAPLRERLAHVLETLTYADARAAHTAIRLANPGGLGEVGAEDVREEPTLTLRETMALAADRDTIAREYVTDYDVTFTIAVPALQSARKAGFDWSSSIVECFLRVLAEVPDTLVARKEGPGVAQGVSHRAVGVLASGEIGSPGRRTAIEMFDRDLRAAGRNPGTTADLTAAALFVVLSEEL
jgi:triphosphoribosyl-dephospho-CoA synthase